MLIYSHVVYSCLYYTMSELSYATESISPAKPIIFSIKPLGNKDEAKVIPKKFVLAFKFEN